MSLSGTSMAFRSIPNAALLRRFASISRSFFFRRFRSRTLRRRSLSISDWTCSSSSAESASPSPSPLFAPPPPPPSEAAPTESASPPADSAAALVALRSARILSRHVSNPLKSDLFNTFRSDRHVLTSDVVCRCPR